MTTQSRLDLVGPHGDRHDEILTPAALDFVRRLHDAFAGRRHQRLLAREDRREAVSIGRDFRFLPGTRHIREDDSWRVAPPAPGLEDRRVEITSPLDRESAARALRSGARTWVADLEDATSPTWANVIGGQLTLLDAVRERTDAPATMRDTPTIIVRPHALHQAEKHAVYFDAAGAARPVSASFVDLGLFLHHNAQRLIDQGRGPYVYLPKLENHLEARLWNDVFAFAEEELGLPHGSIRATVHIETISAAFEMEEILFELRERAAGLNAGRWDYLFSFITYYRARGAGYVFPDRERVSMTVPFMRAYTRLLVDACHRRGAHAIGGLSAFVPGAGSAADRAMTRMLDDKRREAADGFDGTWVGHPELVELAEAEFDAVLGDRPNQLERRADGDGVSADELLDLTTLDRTVTDAGVRENVEVALRYLESWLRGTGSVEIDGLVEDASTAEISRSQLWQWTHAGVETREGTAVTAELVERIAAEVVAERRRERGQGEDDRFDDAARVLRLVSLEPDFPKFLSLPAYARFLCERTAEPSVRAASASASTSESTTERELVGV